MGMNRLNVRIRTRLFQSLLRQEIGFFDVTRSGKPFLRLLVSDLQCSQSQPLVLWSCLCYGSPSRLTLYMHMSRFAGDITSRLSADTTTVSDQVCLNLNVFLRSITQSVVVLYFMFDASWRLTTISFVLVPVIIVISKVYGAYYRYFHSCAFGCLQKHCPIVRGDQHVAGGHRISA